MAQKKYEEIFSKKKLHRGLDNRHLQLIAIGGAIGTGLFMGSGKSIHAAGPSILFVYIIIGVMLFFVMRAMGELFLSDKKYKSFIDFSADFLGPWAGFFIGWTYWLCWIVTGIADIIAIVGYLRFWWPEINSWVVAFGCVFLFFLLNMLAVKLFGELEFWFSIIKVLAIFLLIFIGLYMVFVGFTSEDQVKASFSNVWNHGDMFPNGLRGFFAGFQIAVFSFVGIELVGIAAAEAKDPEKVLPKAINAVPFRIIIFYVLSLFVIMTVTPWENILPDRSPFVHMFVLVGIPIAASFVNFVVLTSAASSANSGVFSTSRMLYGLAVNKNAFLIFKRLSFKSVPLNALFFSCLCIFSAYILLSTIPTILEAFTIITTVSAILFMFVWALILLSYIVYRKRFPERHSKSIYKMPGGIKMCYSALVFFLFILILLAFEKETRIALYFTPIWFVILAGFYQWNKKFLLKRK